MFQNNGGRLIAFMARLWPRVEVNCLTECWTWTGPKKETGYGLFDYRGKSLSAHRYVFFLFSGLIPKHLELDHLCRNRACVNPAHLEPVTHLENMKRGTLATLTHCKWGHQFSGDNLIRDAHGFRKCRECHRRRSLMHIRKKSAAIKETT